MSLNSCKDADCIIAGEGVLVARMVAEKLKIPWISVILQPLAFLSAHDTSVLPVFPLLAKFRVLNLSRANINTCRR